MTEVYKLDEILAKWKEMIDSPADPRDLTPEASYKAGFQRGLQKAYDEINGAAEWK